MPRTNTQLIPTSDAPPTRLMTQVIGGLPTAGGVDEYRRPGGVDKYFRPGGVDLYKRP